MDYLGELATATDEAGFLHCLERLYAQQGIGDGLDFGAVRQYWRGEAALSEAWRRALAEHFQPMRPACYVHHEKESYKRLYAWALSGKAPGHQLGELPPALLNTLLAQAELLKAKSLI